MVPGRPEASRCRPNTVAVTNAPVRLTPTTRSHCRRVSSVAGPSASTPALTTSASHTPNSLVTRRAASSTASWSETSTATG
jgi:hypothetical protein